jgi:heme exporter protein C
MGATSPADRPDTLSSHGSLRPGPMPGADAAKPFGWLFWLAVVAVAGSIVRALAFTPIEALQGPAQKILYVHAPAAFTALYLAFALMAIASVLYLWLGDPKLDRVAACAAEVGLAYTTVVLVTGPLWGKPIWGTWWSGDARLTATLFLWLIIIGYLILRQAVDDRALRARYSAVLAILAGLLVPFIHLTVYLFRTLHPRPIVLKPSAPSMPPEMLLTFGLSFAAFALLFVALLRARYQLAMLADALAADVPEVGS